MTLLDRKPLLAALVAALALPACTDAALDDDLPPCGKCDFLGEPSSDLGARWRGQSEFVSAAPFWDAFPLRTLNEAARSDGQGERSVEDADVFRHDAARKLVYVLNSYRGLQVIDVSTADRPRLVGRAKLGGYPLEMFQRGTTAYVLMNKMVEEGATAEAQGAVLRVYDLANPAAPVVRGELAVPGWIAGSRLLATADSAVIYVASNVWAWNAESGSSEKTVVSSIDVSSPTAPVAVDRVEFPGSGFQLHVTPKAMFVARYDWQDDRTELTYVDIADLGGDVRVRGSIAVAGSLAWGERGELQMDAFGGHLRVASQVRGDWQTGAPTFIRISTIDLANPDRPTPRGSLDVGHGERLLAARFAGERCYLFHMVEVDPLEVIDLSNPAQPVSLAELKIPGWVNHIEVRGDKLLTIGVDDEQSRRLALILFDVSNPSAPVELSRATAGEGWSWTSASHDVKAFSIIDDLGLAMLPVASSSWDDAGGYQFKSWLQLFTFDLAAGRVATAGEVQDVGGIKRSFKGDAQRVLAFSDLSLKSIDVADPYRPAVRADLELARDVADFTTVGAFGVMQVATGMWGQGTAELRTVSLHDPDNSAPLATLDLGVPAGRLFKLDDRTLLHLGSDPVTGETVMATIDYADPFAPELIGSFRAPALGFSRWGRFASWGGAPSTDVAQVGNTLTMYSWPTGGEGEGAKLRFYNLSDRDDIRQSRVFDLGAATVVDMKAEGKKLYVTTSEPVASDEVEALVGTSDPTDPEASIVAELPGGRVSPFFRSGRVRYFLRIVDLSRPSEPRVSRPINVPGRYVGQSRIGTGSTAATILYTMDMLPTPAGAQPALDTMLLVANRRVRLIDVFGLPAGIDKVEVEAQVAWFTSSGWASGPFRMLEDGAADSFRPPFQLIAIDLARPDTVEQLAVHTIEGASYGNLVDVVGGRAFVTGGWSKLMVFDVSQPRAIEQTTALPTLGWWSGKLTVTPDGRAYLPSGLYGLEVVDLED
jgi:hypothetical protein